ncbi:MAG TPA: dTMP kinase, partial [Candidatus Acidoferrum sp.]|nr:dTMP kinase [Candidatus Acidoferrum sp.]
MPQRTLDAGAPPLARHRQAINRLSDLVKQREHKRGLLIAFEGPDGSGKTTQRKLFKGWLKSEGHDVVTTKWNSSNLVKPLVKARKRARSLSPEEFCLLHAADFRYRLETEVLPALWQGKTVLADRFLFTALARDSARGLDLHWLLDVYYPLFWPDMVFYFAVSPETSGKRIAAERSPSYYESGQDVTQIDDPLVSYMRFISRVIREYEALAQIFQFVTVDAEQSIFRSTPPHPRGLFLANQRKPWKDHNRKALTEWLGHRP